MRRKKGDVRPERGISITFPTGNTWIKDASDNKHRCRGTVSPANATVSASVYYDESIAVGLKETPPAGSDFQFSFTLPAATSVTLTVTASSGIDVFTAPPLTITTGS